MKKTFTFPKPTIFTSFAILLFGLSSLNISAQEWSVAREWNEVLLEAVRDDFARPTVHSRNLFHTSVVMYDAWAVYDTNSRPFFLDNDHGGFDVPFEGIIMPDDIQAAQEEALSYAMYRLLTHRFENSPGHAPSQWRFDNLFGELGYDMEFTSTDYIDGSPAALGNYIAEQMIAFGFQDGANEIGGYENLYYEPVNDFLDMDDPGNTTISDPNRWQPLNVTQFIDQGGNEFDQLPDFLGPEWGDVVPFSMTEDNYDLNERDGDIYKTWMDPGAPPYIDPETPSDIEDDYKWSFLVTAIWSGHLDPADGVMIDISPKTLGNINIDQFPTQWSEYPDFYDLLEGGDTGTGYEINPVTQEAYEEQMVLRGDYGRILAEFWADGPDSETPPGHWFTLLNYVSDYPGFEKKWGGEGDVLPGLEWDVKSYLVMGGGMHDVAVAAWSIKGWHDFVRPVSAIRYMAENGQSTDELASNYHPGGIPLVEGYVETVELGDDLAGDMDENVGLIKIRAWKGPDYIANPLNTVAGVDWILVANWWPYQRPTFVTPPFAGFISGHSTFSRCAAELMTTMTGDAYFPGGMGEFHCPQNQFLVFEDGPSMDVTLQWATYRDASDQCSLSRIWGGIHPPADDILGRQIGAELAPMVWDFANACIAPNLPRVDSFMPSTMVVSDSDEGTEMFSITADFDMAMDTLVMPTIAFPMEDPTANTLVLVSTTWNSDTQVEWLFDVVDVDETLLNIWMQITGAMNTEGGEMEVFLTEDMLDVDTENPMALSLVANASMLTDADVDGTFEVVVNFNEMMDQNVDPVFSWPNEDASNTLTVDDVQSNWLDGMTYNAYFTIVDANEELNNVGIESISATDLAGNDQVMYEMMDLFSVDTKNPDLFLLSANTYNITDDFVGDATFSLIAIFDENMDDSMTPDFGFPVENPLANTLTWNEGASEWINASTYVAKYDVADNEETLEDIDVSIDDLTDFVGNLQVDIAVADHFDINTFTVGVQETDLSLMSVFPNPVTSGSDVTVVLENMPQVVTLQVYNLNGQVIIAQREVQTENDRIIVSTANMAAGMYFVHIHSDEGQVVMQLEVQ